MEYGNGDNYVITSFVAGYGGTIQSMEPAALRLVELGHDVVTYEYPKDVLMSGDPNYLPFLIDAIHDNFMVKAAGHTLRRQAGVSMGMGIALNMQRRTQEPQRPAIYAAGGSNVARLIAKNPLFRPVRRAFKQKGHDYQGLQERWTELHESPHLPFAVALGGLDYIVRYREASRALKQWERRGTTISKKVLPLKGHKGTVEWYRHNIPEMLHMADNLAGGTTV